MWQRFSESARIAVFRSQQAAQAAGLEVVEPVALMIGVLASGDEKVGRMMNLAGADMKAVADSLRATLPKGTRTKQDMTLSRMGKQAIDKAYREARRLDHSYIGPEHLLVGLLSVSDEQLSKVLAGFGIDYLQARSALETVAKEPLTSSTTGETFWNRLRSWLTPRRP